MSHKRSRNTFEADNHAPFAVFGTPLPDEAEARDDGSFVPIWKQEVRDEKGRKRLHGAFTGGWSAGYFNTVGSKEGWTPSTFVSSRSNRRKDGPASNPRRAEDYMDEEDLADAAEAQTLQTSQAFAGLGSTTQARAQPGLVMGLFRAEGNTMGLQLLRRMGWKDGQGIGPKVRRGARLGLDQASAVTGGETYLFAPENAPMVRFVRKTDRKGLGHQGEARLRTLGQDRNVDDDDDSGNESAGGGAKLGRDSHLAFLTKAKGKPQPARGAFGVGVLNDTGSDDEDPYDIGPKIKYNRSVGGLKRKKNKKEASAVVNPALTNAPRFVPKTARAGNSLRRCHDGRLPLDGFVLAKVTEDFAALLSQYAPVPIPAGWKSSKGRPATAEASKYVSTADAAKASNHDPRSRAAMLGEKALPGKSVFDYLSASARDKLVTATGKQDLPPARGEVPTRLAVSDEERQRWLLDRAPKLDRDTAVAALSRGSLGPYADDESKRSRYRRYLEHQSNPDMPPPSKTTKMTDDDFLRELNEFYNCARIFKPMTGFMASRFTTSKVGLSLSGGLAATDTEPLSKPAPKPADPAEEAARLGMFGPMTRSIEDFYPTRLLCKRFNVKPPLHSRPDNVAEDGPSRSAAPSQMPESRPVPTNSQAPALEAKGAAAQEPDNARVDPDRNEALEGATANAGVLRAIFGDSDSE
ncbi:hypothetical protein CDD83_319 [Cordyceps sp. RAO-2017]|nr:hypothetical protein CDD83_319 [Cordyceps sp. RAO-2017]